MSFVTSSIIGANLNASSATQLFTLNQTVLGNDGSEWQYIKATGTLATGALVTIFPAGTAQAATTANLIAPGAGVGYSMGFTQFQLAEGEFGFVAKRGHNLVVLCSGTVAPTNVLYLANTPGALTTSAASATLAGIYITTSASTASLVMSGRAILNYPRIYNLSATPIG